MKVFRDCASKLDSTDKHDSNFGNLCMKKSGSFQKERFSFFFNRQWGVVYPEPPLVRTPLVQLALWGKGSRFLLFDSLFLSFCMNDFDVACSLNADCFSAVCLRVVRLSYCSLVIGIRFSKLMYGKV